MTPPPLRVAIIGGGPAAMFFCHAWNQQKLKGGNKRDLVITCFEREATPGGIWRSNSKNLESSAYDELWTNGPCHTLEFYDYTFDEHFEGKPVPVYLPRRDINEYITQRVTKNAPTFFQDYFQFHTEVLMVKECHPSDDVAKEAQFQVTVRNVLTGEVTIHFCDRCIWAAGENSRGLIPQSLKDLFTACCRSPVTAGEKKEPDVMEASFLSHPMLRRFHSTETKSIREGIQGQRVLLIGAGFSAEDLALQCLKWGAAHVDVAARDGEAEISWTSKWPGDRVVVHKGRGIQSVDANGDIHLERVEYVWPHSYSPVVDGASDIVTLRNIHTVVFCTGYSANLSMLDEPLRPSSGCLPQYYGTLQPSMLMHSDPEFGWEDWKMSENQAAHEYTGNVPAAQGRMVRANYNHPDMHRGILFRNPNMMFLCEHGSDAPLLTLDAYAWLLCSYVTERISMPPVDQLREANRQQVRDQMNIPFIRYLMDEEYAKALDDAVESEEDEDDGFWANAQTPYTNYMFRLLARVMEEGQYPGKSLGSYQELNENGVAFIDFGTSSYYMRSDLSDHTKGTGWRTFRDDAIEPEYIHSIYTETKARPLNKRWMDAVGPSHSVKNGI